jgi:hypothetical protein
MREQIEEQNERLLLQFLTGGIIIANWELGHKHFVDFSCENLGQWATNVNHTCILKFSSGPILMSEKKQVKLILMT